MSGLVEGDDGRSRCSWAAEPAEYRAYHDDEWGRPVTDPTRVFEKLCLEAFQSGLSWLTILRKREAFRAAFAGFDIPTVARFGPSDVERLLGDAGIVRHRGKIEAAVANAVAAQRLAEAGMSIAEVFWRHAPADDQPVPLAMADLPAATPASTALARELRGLGFRFVGPTTAYAAMQALGLVDDHLDGCFVRPAVERERRQLRSRLRSATR